MDTQHEIRLHQLIERALDMPEAERRAFLEAECGSNTELFEEVSALIGSEDALGSFLEAPAVDAVIRDPAADWQDPWEDADYDGTTLGSDPAPDPEERTTDTLATGIDPRTGLPRAVNAYMASRPPRPDLPREVRGRDMRIGPYRLLEVLGEGGMGCVYLAEQLRPVKRQVAVKLIRTSLTSVDAQARFHAERQAMARLAHPNIGQMFEAGTTEDGFPYFVMEHVPGIPITKYCDKHQLSIDQRLELFVAVCHGVQHAHQKQILHRDIKPSNILVSEVDGKPVPKIIDFGIAKALDKPLTDIDIKTGAHRIGTPSYMSPEALKITAEPTDVDTRSDVYALGIVLYELLTGSRPFKLVGSRTADVMREVGNRKAPKPSTQLTSLEPATGVRVASSRRAALKDLRRRLADDLDWIVMTAIAREAGDRYGSASELATDVERHLSYEPVSVHPGGFSYRVRKLLRRHRYAAMAVGLVMASLLLGVVSTSLALRKARQAETRALAEAEATRQARDEAEEVVEFLAGLFREATPFESTTEDMRSWEELTAREMFERGAARLADEELADRPLTRARLSRTVADVYKQNGFLDEARRFHQRTLELRLEHLPPDDPRISEAYFSLGLVANASDRLEEAEIYFQQALEIQARQAPPDALARAAILDELGEIRAKTGDNAAAESMLLEGLELRQAHLDPNHDDVAVSLNSLGLLYFRQSRWAEAEQYFAPALEIQRLNRPRGHPKIILALNNLAAAQASQGRFEEAAPIFEETLTLRLEILGEEHPAVAQSLNNLAMLYSDLGRHDEVEGLHRRALAIREKVFGSQHEAVAWSVRNLAMHFLDQGRLDEAEPLFRRALAIRQNVHGAESPAAGNSFYELGELREAQGRWREALVFYQRSLTIREKTLDAGHRRIGRSAYRIGIALCALDRTADGEASLRRAAEILGEDMPEPGVDELTCAAHRPDSA